MAPRKVLCSRVICENQNFEELLRSNFFCRTIQFSRYKAVEISHIEEDENVITGVFVSTQQKDLPPVHKPGNEEDYSAIIIDKGKGLAYPNMFLYCKSTGSLLWEYNRYGLLETGMEYFFDRCLNQEGIESDTKLLPVMNLAVYDRIQNLLNVKEVEIQIAHPTAVLREIQRNSPLAGIAHLADQFGASSSFYLKMKAEVHSMNKNSVFDVLNFMKNNHVDTGRVKNKLVIKGTKVDDDRDRLVEETINFTTDRITDYFPLREVERNDSLQISERKQGIREVYNRIIPDIRAVV
ncbi:MAG: hypothetical protein LIO93_04415 [Bacteroidales bacterium]|nr:hypothetical protein [Bacteroidales bacterium]